MDETLRMMLQEILTSVSRVEDRVSAIETTLAERRGERRVGLWALGSVGGFVGALVTFVVETFLRKHT